MERAKKVLKVIAAAAAALLIVTAVVIAIIALLSKNGSSAYELAVEGGYTGTEEEWLASLNGADGRDGHTPEISISDDGYWVIDGEKTEVKAEGVDGQKGQDGQNGQDGKDGVDGADGQDGKDGKDGADGQDGKDGTVWLSGAIVPDSALGKIGDFYFNSATYDIYTKTQTGWEYVANIKGDDGEDLTAHTHDYQPTSSAVATCTTVGYTRYDCSVCGDFYYEYSGLSAHTFGRYAEGEPNSNICADCGAVYYYYSQGLDYSENSDGTYTITGMGSCTDTEIILPQYHNGKSVTAIAESAFSGWDNEFIENEVIGLAIPASITSIGNGAFGYCRSLEWIYYNAIACADFSNTAMPFRYCGLNGDGVSVTVGAGVQKIPANIFRAVAATDSATSKFIRLEFEEGSKCMSIGNYAFYRCAYLESVTIPESVTSLGNYAFDTCSRLKTVYYNATSLSLNYNNRIFGFAGNSGDGITAYIGANVTRIPSHLFNPYNVGNSYRPNLKSVIFADNSKCTNIGESAFANCNVLEVVDFGENSALQTIGRRSFYQCSSLSGIEMPATVTAINEYAFYGCSAVKEVIVPDGVTEIGGWAFYECASLTVVTIPDTVTLIGSDAFSRCYALKSIIIPNSVTTIENQAFEDCTALESVVLGSGINTIEASAFRYCEALQTVYYSGSEAQWTALCEAVERDNENLTGAAVYYYSETPPDSDGKYWHYENGVPALWQ